MNKIIALDADGVLLNYHEAYADAWGRAFGVRPTVANPNAYGVQDRWGVPTLTGAELEHFRAQFDSSFWATVPVLDGAVEACLNLHRAGHTLVVVSALPAEFAHDRWANLLAHGIPVDQVIATPAVGPGNVSPKAAAIQMLQPVAFVDDYLPYLRGVPRHSTHVALVTRETDGSPNVGPELSLADSTHTDLLQFSHWWLDGGAS